MCVCVDVCVDVCMDLCMDVCVDACVDVWMVHGNASDGVDMWMCVFDVCPCECVSLACVPQTPIP